MVLKLTAGRIYLLNVQTTAFQCHDQGWPIMSELLFYPMQGNRQDTQTEAHKADPGGTSWGCPSVISEAGDELAGAAISSMRVVWTREDQELYKEVLRQHGRSMQHLCAALPNKCASLSPHQSSHRLYKLLQGYKALLDRGREEAYTEVVQ